MQVLKPSELPIYDKGTTLNLVKLRRIYDLQRDPFAKLADLKPTQIREGEPSTIVKNKVVDLVKIINLLWKLSKGREELIRHWLHSPMDEYFGLTPVEFMQLDRKNIKTVFENLQSQVYGEAMGA